MSAPNFPISTFPENSLIFSKGDQATKFFMIQSGSVEIFDPVAKQSIAILSEGDAFGEQAILVGVFAALQRAPWKTQCALK